MRVKLVNYSNHSLTFNSILPISKLDIIMHLGNRLPSLCSCSFGSYHLGHSVQTKSNDRRGGTLWRLLPVSEFILLLDAYHNMHRMYSIPILIHHIITTTFHMLCSFACIINYWYTTRLVSNIVDMMI